MLKKYFIPKIDSAKAYVKCSFKNKNNNTFLQNK